MKRTHCITIITSLFFILNSLTLAAQAPQRMSYQSIIRNAAGELVASTTVGVKVSILKDSQSGTAVYEETFTGATNENGLLTLEIGGGTPLSGTFTAINWSSGIYFVKTETDPTGGSNYSITATGQLLSVPYAFYSSSSSNQGKTSIILTGDVTDAEAAAQLSRELGPNTENIVINGTTQLTTIAFVGVTNLISIDIAENEALTSVSFPSLMTVYKDLNVSTNLVLTSLTFPALKSVYGNELIVNANLSLTTLDLSSLEQVSRGILQLMSNHLLTEINLGSLKKVQSSWIHDNTSMISLDLSHLQKCASEFKISANPLLVSMNCSSFLESFFITIDDNQSLTSVDFPDLVTSNFNITNCGALQSISIPLLTNTSIGLDTLPSLTTVNFNSFDLGQITIGNTGITALALTNMHNPMSVSLFSNPQLVSVDLSGLQTVKYFLGFSQNEVLSSIVLPDNLSFEQPDTYAAVNLQYYALTSTAINNLLHKFLTYTPSSGMIYRLNGQTPPAPPAAQGLLDKQTLLDRPNTVITD